MKRSRLLPLLFLFGIVGGVTAFALSDHDGGPRWVGWMQVLRGDEPPDPDPEPDPRIAPPEPLPPARTEAVIASHEPGTQSALGDGLVLHIDAAPDSIADRLVTPLHRVTGDLRGTRTLEIEFDPARLIEPTVFQVFDGQLMLPVEATIEQRGGIAVARVEADVSMSRPNDAMSFLQTSPTNGGARVEPDPPPIAYAVGDPWHPRCRHGRRGETEFLPGSRVAFGFLEDADCALGRSVAALVTEALDYYAEGFSDAGGSPLRRYNTSTPLLVFLHHQPGVNGAYSIWSTRGHVYVDIASARSNPDGLRETMFHEMFHAVQDHYATMSATGVLGSHWWFEGSAEWAGLVARGIGFEEAIGIELRESGVLSVAMNSTSRYGTMSYATSLYMFFAEAREPGFVARMLQSDATRGATYLAETQRAAGFPGTYRELVETIIRAAPGAPWRRARFMAVDAGVRKQSTDEISGGLAPATPRPWAEPSDARGTRLQWMQEWVSFVAEPYTAHFVSLTARGSEPVRVRASSSTPNVLLVRDGAITAATNEIDLDPLTDATLVLYHDEPEGNRRFRVDFFFERGEEEGEPVVAVTPPPRMRADPPPRMRADPPPRRARSLAGNWSFSAGCMNLEQSGSRVSGSVHGHRHGDGGRVSGTIADGSAQLDFNLGSTRGTVSIDLGSLRGTTRLNNSNTAFTLRSVARCQDAPDTSLRCYDACLQGCRIGMFACGVEGERVTPEVYCDGLQRMSQRAGSPMGFFFECMQHTPAAWRAARATPIPGTRSLVPQVNPNGRARMRE